MYLLEQAALYRLVVAQAYPSEEVRPCRWVVQLYRLVAPAYRLERVLAYWWARACPSGWASLYPPGPPCW